MAAGAHEASQLYDDGRPYNREVLTAEVRHHLGQGVLAMLEAGKRLIVLKEHEEHGVWGGATRSHWHPRARGAANDARRA